MYKQTGCVRGYHVSIGSFWSASVGGIFDTPSLGCTVVFVRPAFLVTGRRFCHFEIHCGYWSSTCRTMRHHVPIGSNNSWEGVQSVYPANSIYMISVQTHTSLKLGGPMPGPVGSYTEMCEFHPLATCTSKSMQESNNVTCLNAHAKRRCLEKLLCVGLSICDDYYWSSSDSK